MTKLLNCHQIHGDGMLTLHRQLEVVPQSHRMKYGWPLTYMVERLLRQMSFTAAQLQQS
jgi:hypothetical protein